MNVSGVVAFFRLRINLRLDLDRHSRWLTQVLAQRRVLSSLPAVVLLACLVASPGTVEAASLPPPAPEANSDDFQKGTIIDVQRAKRIVPNGRWFAVHEFTVDLTVKMGDQTYRAEFDTVVVDLVHEVESSKGQTAQVSINGKVMRVKLASGRDVKAYLISK